MVRPGPVNKTVFDSDWRFDNLCGSHLQSQTMLHVNDDNSCIRYYFHRIRFSSPFITVTLLNWTNANTNRDNKIFTSIRIAKLLQ